MHVLTLLTVIGFFGTQAIQTTPTPNTFGNYASERRAHSFAGATQVTVNNFDPQVKGVKSVKIQFDKNAVTYDSVGDTRFSTVFYQPIEVKLKELDFADPEQKHVRGIYALEIPKEAALALGKSSLRLVTLVGNTNQPPMMRLLLLDSTGKVTDVLILRPTGK